MRQGGNMQEVAGALRHFLSVHVTAVKRRQDKNLDAASERRARAAHRAGASQWAGRPAKFVRHLNDKEKDFRKTFKAAAQKAKFVDMRKKR